MSLQRGVLLLLALSACVAAQSCSDISAISNGAKADGKTNDAAVFAAMNSKSSIGLIFFSGAGSGGLGLPSRRLKLHACLRSSPGHRGDTPCG